jgi:sigma-E factor negative regulatory protein RseB
MRRVAPGPGAVTALVLLLGVAAPTAAAGGPAPLEQARQAAEQHAFEGVLEVRWRDGAELRSERLNVEAAGGSLVVRGANQVMARPAFGRLLAHAGKGWEEMWLPSLAPAPRPEGIPKYQTTAAGPGPDVAGRPTTVVEVHRNRKRLERIYLDTQTNLLLQREQFDAQGEVVRTLAFSSLRFVAPSTGAPAAPASPAHHAPKAVDPDRLTTQTAAPPALGEGYARMGVFRGDSVLHVLYSDGLYDLSLFQQQGRLRRSDLPPSGVEVAVGGTTGWRYPWPGGQLVVWSTGGRVFTAVSDAPADQVLAAVRSLPEMPKRELSLLGKIRRACQALMEPLA